jgi:hypothetical protein
LYIIFTVLRLVMALCKTVYVCNMTSRTGRNPPTTLKGLPHEIYLKDFDKFTELGLTKRRGLLIAINASFHWLIMLAAYFCHFC